MRSQVVARSDEANEAAVTLGYRRIGGADVPLRSIALMREDERLVGVGFWSLMG